ncbi:Ester hydrolase C11orf54 -like protein [Halotydeus destructor]|nr:Ester hydrolase C11orf54 -like protein [Halotydeus destructor]
MGGVFLIKSGKAKIHVMPDFSKTPLTSDDDVNNWLKFFECEAPLVCLSTLHSTESGLDLRMEHTHCFSNHGQGGHYHYDTTPDEIEYEAYYNVAETLHRIDRPKETHNIGRD